MLLPFAPARDAKSVRRSTGALGLATALAAAVMPKSTWAAPRIGKEHRGRCIRREARLSPERRVRSSADPYDPARSPPPLQSHAITPRPRLGRKYMFAAGRFKQIRGCRHRIVAQ